MPGRTGKTEKRLEQVMDHVDTLSRLQLLDRQQEHESDMQKHLDKMLDMHDSLQKMQARQMDLNRRFAVLIGDLQQKMRMVVAEIDKIKQVRWDDGKREYKLRRATEVPETG